MGRPAEAPEIERRISLLSRDFNIEVREDKTGPAYKLGEFRAFVGQEDHDRHEQFMKYRARIS